MYWTIPSYSFSRSKKLSTVPFSPTPSRVFSGTHACTSDVVKTMRGALDLASRGRNKSDRRTGAKALVWILRGSARIQC
jgi:hypothetical protein